MRKASLFVLCVLVFGCDDESGSDESICASVCSKLVDANCSSSPIVQADCEADCVTLRAGPCRQAQEDLLDCADGDPTYECNPAGGATVAGCESEAAAVDQCVDGN